MPKGDRAAFPVRLMERRGAAAVVLQVRSPWRRAALLAVAFLACLAGPANFVAAAPLDTIPIKLRRVRWQALPGEVRAVYVGPDDRVWYQLHETGDEADPDSLRAGIKKAFRSRSPQLTGARPALFEPGRRVWFIAEDETLLLGYDGKQWIERRATAGHFFTGVPVNHGRIHGDSHNLSVDGTAFFTGSHGVHVLHEGEWSYREMHAVKHLVSRGDLSPELIPVTGQGSVLAFNRFWEGTVLWRWNGGDWEEIALPKSIRPGTIRDVVPHLDAVHAFVIEGRIVQVAAGSMGKGDVSELLKNLLDESYQVREKATSDLIERGADVKPVLEKALSQARDPEVKWRLQRILKAVQPAGAGGQVRMGGYGFTGPSLVHHDGLGYTYIGVQSIDVGLASPNRQPGILVSDPRGDVRPVSGKALVDAWHRLPGPDSGPLALVPGRSVWMQGNPGVLPPRLVDLWYGGFVTMLPDSGAYWLHAVTSGGTVFAGFGRPGDPGSGPVMAYMQGVPDDRKHLPAPELQLSGHHYAVGEDGAVLAWARTGAGSVFDGDQWRKAEGKLGARMLPLVMAGSGGTFIAETMAGTVRSFVMAGAGVENEDKDLRTLIARNREEVARRFASGRRRGTADSHRGPAGIHAEGVSRIWLRYRGEVAVLAGEEWIDARGTLVEAGSRRGVIVHMEPLGEGRRVYMLEASTDGGRSFYGEMRGGKLAIEQASHLWDPWHRRWRVRDAEGNVWVPSAEPPRKGPGEIPVKQLALRIPEHGPVGVVENSGWPRLYDEGGNLWLGSIRGRAADQFNVWREGRVVHTVTVPGADASTALVSDRAGSVFALTRAGLVHLAAPDPKKPAAFEVKKIYSYPGMGTEKIRVEYSKLGYLLVCRARQDGKCWLQAIELPGEEG